MIPTATIKDIRERLDRLRGSVVERGGCRCCGTWLEWDTEANGEYLQWSDVNDILTRLENDATN